LQSFDPEVLEQTVYKVKGNLWLPRLTLSNWHERKLAASLLNHSSSTVKDWPAAFVAVWLNDRPWLEHRLPDLELLFASVANGDLTENQSFAYEMSTPWDHAPIDRTLTIHDAEILMDRMFLDERFFLTHWLPLRPVHLVLRRVHAAP
jgi:hypothetical protein